MRTLLLLMSIILLAGCSRPQKETPPAGAPQAVPVKATRVAEKEITDRLTVNGVIEPLWSIDVFADAAGKIIEKHVERGQRVTRGQVLARLLQDVPGMEFAPIDITAPVSGVLMTEALERGARVSPNRACAVIANTDTMSASIRLIESDYHLIRVGAACGITAAALPGQSFSGRVRRLDPQLDSRTRTAGAEIQMVNASHLLRPGMSVTCEFESARRRVLTLPLDAVVRVGAGYRIVKVVNGSARFTDVSAGAILNGEIEITGPVALNDLVVVYGQNLLQDGLPVEIVP